MNINPPEERDAATAEDTALRALYAQLIASWNARDADGFAATFAPDGESIGFDGSLMRGRAEIATTLGQIFADHVTAPYISKIREVRPLSPDVAIVRTIVGMVPPGQTDLNPAVNAHHTLVAVKRDGAWQIALFQNTPAQFHGRPDLVEQMTAELREMPG